MKRASNSYPAAVRLAMSLALLAGLTVPAASAFGQDTRHPLSLRDAINMAMSNNPALRETAEKMNQMSSQVSLDRSTLFPTLSVTAKAMEQKDAVNTNNAIFDGDPYNNYNTDIHLAQPLYTYGSIRAVQAAEKDSDIAHINTQIAARDLTSQVVQAYYQVILNMRLVDTYKRQLVIEQESLDTAVRRARTGRAQELDVLQTRTQIALLRSDVSTAENSVQTAAASLASLLGDSRQSMVRIRDTLDAPTPEVIDREIDLKTFVLPELERNRLDLAQVEDQKKVALGQNLPNLSLVGDYTFNAYKQADLIDAPGSAWAFGVELTIPVLSGGSSFFQQQVLDSEKMQLEFDRLNIQNQTNLQQVTARKNLETAQQTIIQGGEALRLAIATSDEARRMYRFSTIDFLSLLTVETSYVQAESSFNQYKFNYIVALVNYFVASGQSTGHLIDLLERAAR